MKGVLAVLVACRGARREAAVGRLASARRQLSLQQSAWQFAAEQTHDAIAWRGGLLAGEGMAHCAHWRQAMLPSAEALIEQRVLAVKRAEAELQSAQKTADDCRAALALAERAMLRTDELAQLSKQQDRADQEVQEQGQDDDLAAAFKHRKLALGLA